jgi:predicted MPP superfamily phosphohydrolase
MNIAPPKRGKIAERFNTLISAERPIRELVSNFSKVAKYAIDEANSLSLERVTVNIARLPKKLDGLKIIHLSDIHHSPLTGLEHIERTVKIVNRLHPDMIALTGDFVSHDATYIKPVAKVLGELTAECGVHACLGNHDHWTDPEMVTNELTANGINVLVNRGERIETRDASFWLAGVDDHMVGKTDLPEALKGSFADEMKILLAHNPIIFRQAIRAGVDLTLSGHTHGGQVRVRDSNRRMIRRRRVAGLHTRKGSNIYITRGIGTVVLPVRYQCPPEISMLELRCEDVS